MAKLPTIEEMAQNVAEKALDEIEYEGKTLREWVKIILATDTNVATKLGTNLAEVGTDCISREQAIETFKDCAVNGVGIDGIVDALKQLPSAQPERKKGKWIRKSPTAWSWTCSCCKKDDAYAYSAGKSFEPDVLQDLYCPNCGADMRGEQDG